MIDFDPIALIEHGYHEFDSEVAWLEAIAGAVRAPLDTEDLGVAAYFLEPGGPRDLVAFEGGGALSPRDILAVTNHEFDRAPAGTVERLFRAAQTPGFATLVEVIGPLPDLGLPVPMVDSPALVVNSADGLIAIVAFAITQRVEVDELTRQLWRRVALHLGAGLRMLARPRTLDAEDVEVVIDHRGAVAHAAGEGTGVEARAAVRQAVVRLDRARAREGRADPVEALELWHALVAGRWSLVEQFDSDGRRFVCARRNDPSVVEPRGLTRRQRQIAFYGSLGWSLKEIGYALGLAETTVSDHLTAVLERLGLRSRAELIRLSLELMASNRGEPRQS